MVRLDEKDLEQSLFDRYAMLHKQRRGHYPLLVETECYTYMGQGVKIVSCNVFDSIKNAEVVIESRDSNVATVEFQELSWKFSRVTINSMSEISQDEYIANGPHNDEIIEKHAQLRFAIQEGRSEAENGKQSRESVFTDLLNRCDRLGIAIGIPTAEEKSECQSEPHTTQSASSN